MAWLIIPFVAFLLAGCDTRPEPRATITVLPDGPTLEGGSWRVKVTQIERMDELSWRVWCTTKKATGHWLVVTTELTNTGTTPAQVDHTVDFSVHTADGRKLYPVGLYADNDGTSSACRKQRSAFLASGVEPGATVTTVLAFDIPKDCHRVALTFRRVPNMAIEVEDA